VFEESDSVPIAVFELPLVFENSDFDPTAVLFIAE